MQHQPERFQSTTGPSLPLPFVTCLTPRSRLCQLRPEMIHDIALLLSAWPWARATGLPLFDVQDHFT